MGEMNKHAKRCRTPWEYPAGEDDFPKLREKGCVYVDKTSYIYNMTRMGYIFLCRPRRFGKSLLCSTLEAYFQGRKELFEGLAIENLETEWKKYPVLRFNISSLKDKKVTEMEDALGFDLHRYEKLYGVTEQAKTPGNRLKALIQEAHRQTGSGTVVIIDEYDSPMLKYLHDEENKPEVRRILQEFYTPLKECSADLRFVFITGITKFSQMSIFSSINNLTNISMDTEYAHICGITKSEFESQFMDDVEQLADYLEMSPEECYARMKLWYDGYHFSEVSDDIYNPYSLMKAFSQRKIRSYWFDSGHCTFLIGEMKRHYTQVHRLDGSIAEAAAFDQPIETVTDALPLIYQSGYLTIKNFKPITSTYTLGIPNNDVRAGLMKNVLPMLTGTTVSENMSYSTNIINSLDEGHYDEAMEYLRAFLLSIPNTHQGEPLLEDLARLEALYQRDLYIFFQGMGYQVRTEVEMALGRVDMIMWIGAHIFAFEFKMSASCRSAIAQMDMKKYIEPWRCGPVRLTKCAIRFSAAERTVTDWTFEEVQ